MFLSDFQKSWNFSDISCQPCNFKSASNTKEYLEPSSCMQVTLLFIIIIVILKKKVKPKLSNTIAGDDFLPRRYLRFGILFVSNELTIPRKNSVM